ncbi:hypothetical protein A0H81_08690 [Grifola frondosa]|uniref:Uncharacterized protein n=1 Tax=Grifola frondosa TaxID=5627 RepID=A0A1C7M543_GRIFR|nr:hypothetical protein A0H81_08690 [Grifola frondosa]
MVVVLAHLDFSISRLGRLSPSGLVVPCDESLLGIIRCSAVMAGRMQKLGAAGGIILEQGSSYFRSWSIGGYDTTRVLHRIAVRSRRGQYVFSAASC